MSWTNAVPARSTSRGYEPTVAAALARSAVSPSTGSPCTCRPSTTASACRAATASRWSWCRVPRRRPLPHRDAPLAPAHRLPAVLLRHRPQRRLPGAADAAAADDDPAGPRDTQQPVIDRRPQPRRHAGARGAAHRAPSQVKQVITMGSPFRSVRAHPLVLSVANFVRSNIVRRAQAPPRGDEQVLHAAVLVRVRQRRCAMSSRRTTSSATRSTRSATASSTGASCIEDDETLNREVTATHIGMAFNPDVYRTVGNLLGGVA